MSGQKRPKWHEVWHEFRENVNDGECLCGISCLTHDLVYPPIPQVGTGNPTPGGDRDH